MSLRGCWTEFLRIPIGQLFCAYVSVFMVQGCYVVRLICFFLGLNTFSNVRASAEANMACECRYFFQCLCGLGEDERRGRKDGQCDLMIQYKTKGDETTCTSEDNDPNVLVFWTLRKTGVDYSEFKRTSGSLVLIASH